MIAYISDATCAAEIIITASQYITGSNMPWSPPAIVPPKVMSVPVVSRRTDGPPTSARVRSRQIDRQPRRRCAWSG